MAKASTLKHLWLSPWTSWVGFRYLKSKKNSRFLSFITLLSIFGVALGVTSMIVVLSVMNGFESELKKRLMSSDLHILVQPTSDTPGFDQGYVPQSILQKDQLADVVQGFWPIVQTEVIFKAGKRVTGAVVKGVPAERMNQVKSRAVETAEEAALWDRGQGAPIRLPGVWVGQELAYEMGLLPGDQITLISPTEMEGPLQNIPRFKRCVIEGIYKSGLPEQELHTLFALDSSVRSFLRKPHVVSQWEITLPRFDQAQSVASLLRVRLPQFRVQDWQELNSHLFSSLKLERLAMFIILAFIIIVASFNIVTTLTLMVLEKKKEISIMKAMGARDSQVAAIFLAEGLFIGSIGVSSGLGIGLLLCVLLRKYEFITLPDIFYDRTLPVTFDPRYYLIVGICAVLIVLAACLYPSQRAANLNPLDGIRY